MQFLRGILQVPSAYIARNWPYSRVWSTINAHSTRKMNAKPPNGLTFTHDLHVQVAKLLAQPQDPLSVTTISPTLEAIPTFFTCRVGGPH
eukprot:3045990-Amphidinium_carterae.1